MLVANHKSMIDIMLMLSIAKYPVVFVGKKELEKIPILDIYIEELLYLLIDQALKVEKEFMKNLRKD